MRRILVAASVVVLASLVSVASPAQAASGPWSVVSTGGSFTCAINTSKSLYCWGNNDYGQIGDRSHGTDRPSPTQVGASGAWVSVAAGRFHTCAISTGKSLYCWGGNDYGQIGDATTGTDRLSPKRIGVAGVWADVAAGGYHTCAISTGNSLYCWGNNDYGQIGDGTIDTDRHSPKRIGGAGAWAGVTGGSIHTCAISTGKSLYCWGYNSLGSVGDGTTIPRPSPRRIGNAGGWALAEAGDYHTCGISTGKSLYCWGVNDVGQIGDRTSGIDRHSPTKVGASGAWARVNAGGTNGQSHTCAISTGKSLYCWGFNFYGEIGDGTTTDRHSSKRIGTAGVWAAASGGGYHTCAITTGKALYCWGHNANGQVGDGTATSPRPSPRKVA